MRPIVHFARQLLGSIVALMVVGGVIKFWSATSVDMSYLWWGLGGIALLGLIVEAAPWLFSLTRDHQH